jgi:hypothetical protein
VDITLVQSSSYALLSLSKKASVFGPTASTAKVVRVLKVNVVKAFNPGPANDIFMNVGDLKTIDLSPDPDTACYNVAPKQVNFITGGLDITLTPSYTTILDITASQPGIHNVKLKVIPKFKCQQKYPDPSSDWLSFMINVYNSYNPALVTS